MEIISKELLSEVLGYKILSVKDLKDGRNNISFDHERINNMGLISDYNFINIHELAHKCEGWAYLNYGFRLIIWFDEITSYCEIYNSVGYETHEIGDLEHGFDEQCPKYEMVIKACQWMLDNKN